MRPRLLQIALPLCALCTSGCDREPTAAADSAQIVRHDFGIIPHGEIPGHDFVLEPPADLGPLVPLTYRGDCSCTRFQLILRGRDGNERVVPGYVAPEYAIGPDEQLILRLAIDTGVKEPVDQDPVTSRGTVVLQDPAGARPRVTLGVEITYAIDAPVTVSPTAHFAFPNMPRQRSVTLQRRLRADRPEPVRFGPVHSPDDRLQGRITPKDGFALLEATFTPDPDAAPGPFMTTLSVETDLDGYVLEIPVSGRVIPDITVSPINKISLGQFDFGEAGAEQFVTVMNHVRDRDLTFEVVSLRDAAGNDASQHFAVHLEAVNGTPHSTRVRLRYTGGLAPPRFRGELILAADPIDGPFVPIELVAFHRK